MTIAEGLTLSRIAEILHEKEITDKEEFIDAAHDEELLLELGIPGDSAEGYIYPDTYKFAKEFPAENTLRFLVQSFWNTLSGIYPEYKTMTSTQIYRNVIIASIVEREYRVADEAPYIASVFLNRLEIGMPLQSCATVVYALTQEYGKPHPRFLTYRDLEVESSYNTYQINGLPPAPISNPGKTALESVFFPAETDYLYFVLQNPDDGRHYFSKTLSEHNRAKQFYIKER